MQYHKKRTDLDDATEGVLSELRHTGKAADYAEPDKIETFTHRTFEVHAYVQDGTDGLWKAYAVGRAGSALAIKRTYITFESDLRPKNEAIRQVMGYIDNFVRNK